MPVQISFMCSDEVWFLPPIRGLTLIMPSSATLPNAVLRGELPFFGKPLSGIFYFLRRLSRLVAPASSSAGKFMCLNVLLLEFLTEVLDVNDKLLGLCRPEGAETRSIITFRGTAISTASRSSRTGVGQHRLRP